MLAFASRGTLGMIVSDASFLPAFRRSLIRLGHDPQAVRRIEAVAASDRVKLRALVTRVDALYVSPLIAADVAGLIPPMGPLLPFGAGVPPSAPPPAEGGPGRRGRDGEPSPRRAREDRQDAAPGPR